MGYKDKEFCVDYLLCKNHYNCQNCLTQENKDKAAKWAEESGFKQIPIFARSALYWDCFVPFFEEKNKEKIND